MTPISPALSVDDAAKLLFVSRTHIMNMIHGKVKDTPPLPAVKLGTTYRIRQESFERWLAQCEGTGT